MAETYSSGVLADPAFSNTWREFKGDVVCVLLLANLPFLLLCYPLITALADRERERARRLRSSF